MPSIVTLPLGNWVASLLRLDQVVYPEMTQAFGYFLSKGYCCAELSVHVGGCVVKDARLKLSLDYHHPRFPPKLGRRYGSV